MNPFAVILFFITLYLLVIRPITILSHELGHAVMILILTKQLVTIYIGSYGDPNRCIYFKLGLLEFRLKYNPLLWFRGCCVPTKKNTTINEQIIYTASGVLIPFFLSIISCCFSFFFNAHGSIKFISALFVLAFVIDFCQNLIPRPKKIILYNGEITHNDGYVIKQLFYQKRLLNKYGKAIELYNNLQFEEAASAFHEMIMKGIRDNTVYKLAINSYIHIKKFCKAKELSDEHLLTSTADSEGFTYAGIIYSYYEQHDKSLEYFEKSLELNPNNVYSLINKGHVLNTIEKYEESIPFFDKAIRIDNTFAVSYSGRGLAKVKTHMLEDGLIDINHAIELDPSNSDGYCSLGIHHYDNKKYKIALDLFKKAKGLDNNDHKIDELIALAEAKLENFVQGDRYE